MKFFKCVVYRAKWFIYRIFINLKNCIIHILLWLKCDFTLCLCIWTHIYCKIRGVEMTYSMWFVVILIHCWFNSLWTVFTMKCTASANPITLNRLFIGLCLRIICVKNLGYYFDDTQFWINSHFVVAFSSLSLLTLMLTLIS